MRERRHIASAKTVDAEMACATTIEPGSFRHAQFNVQVRQPVLNEPHVRVKSVGDGHFHQTPFRRLQTTFGSDNVQRIPNSIHLSRERFELVLLVITTFSDRRQFGLLLCEVGLDLFPLKLQGIDDCLGVLEFPEEGLSDRIWGLIANLQVVVGPSDITLRPLNANIATFQVKLKSEVVNCLRRLLKGGTPGLKLSFNAVPGTFQALNFFLISCGRFG